MLFFLTQTLVIFYSCRWIHMIVCWIRQDWIWSTNTAVSVGKRASAEIWTHFVTMCRGTKWTSIPKTAWAKNDQFIIEVEANNYSHPPPLFLIVNRHFFSWRVSFSRKRYQFKFHIKMKLQIIPLLSKPYLNEVTLREKKGPLKWCQPLDFWYTVGAPLITALF